MFFDDIDLVKSIYHGHKIAPWAVEEKCYFCSYPASHKVTEDYAGPSHPLTAYVCCDHFWSSCKNAHAPRCRACFHPWHEHDKEIELQDKTLYECLHYTGMGDWCGCEKRRPVDV